MAIGEGSASAILEPGTVVTGYRIESMLGHGGMGVVYEATQLSLGRTVALKVIAAHLSHDPIFRERFRREGMLQAALDHPHIVTVHEAGESPSGLFIAMQLVRGPRLKDLIMIRELDARRSLRMLRPVGDALDAAHEAGLIHRDVKPQNVLVGARDHAFLADFGLTKLPGDQSLTGSGHFVGTVDYVSPEQIVGEPATPLSDVYSFAAVLYESLTGVVPYPRESDAAVLYSHLSDPPPRPSDRQDDLPEELDAVVARAMSKDPSERYATAAELIEATEDAFGSRVRPIKPAHPARISSSAGTLLPHELATQAVAPPAGTEPLASQKQPERRGGDEPSTSVLPVLRGRRAIGALVACGIALAGAGALAGALTGNDKPATAGTAQASGAKVALSIPRGWAAVAPRTRVKSLRLVDPAQVALAGQAGDAGLLLGIQRDPGPRLLPEAFLATLPAVPANPDPVRLGEVVAQRYRGLEPRSSGRRMTLYVVPTSAGVATIACFAPARSAREVLTRCEGAATTLRLTGADAYPLTPDRTYAATLDRIVQRLNPGRLARRGRIRAAQRPAHRARVAHQIGALFSAGARSVTRLRPPKAAAAANAAIAAAFTRAAKAYDRSASAIRAQDNRRNEAANRAVRDAEAAVQRGFDSLRPLGYDVR
jgi:hypothetical protein